MAYFLRRRFYNTERQYRSSVRGSDWPKDRLLCPKDRIYFCSTKNYYSTRESNLRESVRNEDTGA